MKRNNQILYTFIRLCFLMLFVISLTSKTSAQTIENIRTTADNERVIIEYDLVSGLPNTANILVRFKINNAKVITPSQISGDLNAVLPGRNKRIVWEALKEMGAITAEIAVELIIQSNRFKEVKIGTQVWMVENLNVERFRNGEQIPEAKTEKEWMDAGRRKQPAWCYYNNDPANGKKHGKLYNWYAVNDPRGLAPEGWHIPSDKEWLLLTDYMGGKYIAGGKMKNSTGWYGFYYDSNENRFLGLMSGSRSMNGLFDGIRREGHWWSSTEEGAYRALFNYLYSYSNNVFRNSRDKGYGLSIRCLRD